MDHFLSPTHLTRAKIGDRCEGAMHRDVAIILLLSQAKTGSGCVHYIAVIKGGKI